jgi:rhamnogalacturonyl hydrolase YesR
VILQFHRKRSNLKIGLLLAILPGGLLPALARAQAMPAAMMPVAMVPAATQPASTQPVVYQGDGLRDLMKRVMNFQIKAYGAKEPVVWQADPFWLGVLADYKATGDEDFNKAAVHFGESNDWKVGKRTFHADDISVGQAYLIMYQHDKNPVMMADIKSRLDQYLDKKTVTGNEDGGSNKTAALPFVGKNVWWWCDALFMAPPVLADMSSITGDKRYLDLMDTLYWDSANNLLDPDENLFFRDPGYFFDKKKSPTGKKIFWARGNGWVYAGLIRTIDAMPVDDPRREKYIDLFKKMTPAIVKYQQDDGMWRASLNEPTWIPNPESTGSGFFTYGLLAGINRGFIDRPTYLPNALRAWRGLSSVVTPEGGVGFAQNVGSAPAAATADSFKDYSQGAFLLAASEMYGMKLTAEEMGK